MTQQDWGPKADRRKGGKAEIPQRKSILFVGRVSGHGSMYEKREKGGRTDI